MEVNTIVEETGYSYSGVSDLLREEPEKTKEFLNVLSNEFQTVQNEISEKKKELEKLESLQGMLTNCFIYAHKILIKDLNKELTFIIGNSCIVIEVISESKMKYARFESIIKK